jgi:hypothetical protein
MTCATPTLIVGGISIPTNEFANAAEIITKVSGDQGDPTYDEYEGNVAGGNNTTSTQGIQVPGESGSVPEQTTLPEAIPIKAEAEVVTPPPGGNGTPVTVPGWDGSNYDISMSPNFKLRNFTIGAASGTGRVIFPHPLPLTSVAGYTMQQRFSNLAALSVNIAEPLLAKFGPFQINSGLRNDNSVKPPGVSQHVTGQAIDVQFAGWTYDRYWENAQWVKDNIKYDQFIFEHSSTTGLAWFHLSFNQQGNRAASNRTKVMTMYRNKYDSGLKRYL